MKRIFTLSILLGITNMISAQAPRTSLLEISESVFTQDNARTICLKEEVRSAFGDDLAILSFHPDDFQGPGFSEDPFFNNASDQWWNIYGTPGFGQGHVDRVSYNGSNFILGRTLWNDTLAARVNRTSIGLVTLPEVLYDPAKREIFTRIQIDFEKENIELKDFRFFIYVAADNQLGIQRFDTLDATLCTAFIDPNDTNYFLTDTLDTFYHNDVVIANPSTFEGIDGVIPNEVVEGARYTTTITYTVPAAYDINDLNIVGFVADYDGNDVTSNELINAAKANSFTNYDSEDTSDPNHPENPDNPNSVFNQDYWPNGINDARIEEGINVYTNPVRELGLVEFVVPHRQVVSVSIRALDGRLVQNIYQQTLSQGTHRAAFTNAQISSGLYLISIEGEDFRYIEKVVVE